MATLVEMQNRLVAKQQSEIDELVELLVRIRQRAPSITCFDKDTHDEMVRLINKHKGE